MNNKFKIVETEYYILAISDKIEDGINPKVLHFDDKVDKNNIYKSSEMFTGNPMYLHISGIDDDFRTVRKIIAYQSKGNVKELDLPLLPEIVVEDDVDEIFEKETKTVSFGENGNQSPYNWFKMGYNAATKVYSEEDIRRIAQFAFSFHRRNDLDDDELEIEFNRLLDKNIQALKQPKTPKWFVAETTGGGEYLAGEVGGNEIWAEYPSKLKTTSINNKTYLVGTYE